MDSEKRSVSLSFESFIDFLETWHSLLVGLFNGFHPCVNFMFEHGTNAAELDSLAINPSVNHFFVKVKSVDDSTSMWVDCFLNSFFNDGKFFNNILSGFFLNSASWVVYEECIVLFALVIRDASFEGSVIGVIPVAFASCGFS